MPTSAGVVGAGIFGKCLAGAPHKHGVTIGARNGEIADAIDRHRRVPRCSTREVRPDNVCATRSLEEAPADGALGIGAVQAHGARMAMRQASEFFP